MNYRHDPIAAVAQAEDNLNRLLAKREAALEGGGPAPDPKVVKAAEDALERARERMRQAVAA